MTLEQEVMQSVRDGLSKAIHERLSGYGSPVQKYVDQVVDAHAGEIRTQLDNALVAAISGADFRAAVHAAFTHKLAKVLLSKMEGAVEKVTNTLRSDPAIRARMTLAIEQIIKDSSVP